MASISATSMPAAVTRYGGATGRERRVGDATGRREGQDTTSISLAITARLFNSCHEIAPKARSGAHYADDAKMARH